MARISVADGADFAARASMVSETVDILLKYIQRGQSVSVTAEGVRIVEPNAILLHWAFSRPMLDLAATIAADEHQIRRPLADRVYEGPQIRGTLDATATVLLRATSGDPSRFVSRERVRSPHSGANLALVGVLRRAVRSLDLADIRSRKTSLPELFRARVDRIEEAKRVVDMRLPGLGTLSDTPIRSAITAARREKSPLYHRVAEALELYEAAEAGDRVAMASIISESVVAPGENWRLFELFVGAKILDALSTQTGWSAIIRWMLPGVGGAFATVGPYELYWQNHSPDARRLEPTVIERRTRELHAAFGYRASADRPDLLVRHRGDGVIAIVEVKFSDKDSPETADGQLRDGLAQLVQYSEHYRVATDDQDALVTSSLVALWGALPSRRASVGCAPTVVVVNRQSAAIAAYCSEKILGPTAA